MYFTFRLLKVCRQVIIVSNYTTIVLYKASIPTYAVMKFEPKWLSVIARRTLSSREQHLVLLQGVESTEEAEETGWGTSK